MSQGRMGWARPWLMTVAVALATATVGAALAQDAAPGGRGKAASKARRGKAAKTNKADKANKKGRPAPADPLAKAVEDTLAKAAPPGTGHYKFRMNVPGDTTLAATYYPAKLGTTAPVVLLIHEKDRSGKDFEEAIGELKGQGPGRALAGRRVCRPVHRPPRPRRQPAPDALGEGLAGDDGRLAGGVSLPARPAQSRRAEPQQAGRGGRRRGGEPGRGLGRHAGRRGLHPGA